MFGIQKQYMAKEVFDNVWIINYLFEKILQSRLEHPRTSLAHCGSSPGLHRKPLKYRVYFNDQKYVDIVQDIESIEVSPSFFQSLAKEACSPVLANYCNSKPIAYFKIRPMH